jgi:transcriptional regulator with XRE-family HTH domain
MYLSIDSPHPHRLTLGALVARRRGRLGLSQAILAARCQMPLTELELFEQNQFLPSSAQSFTLAEILGLDPVLLCHAELLQCVLGPDLGIVEES